MKYLICSIYDSGTEAYMRPFLVQATGQAMRLFSDLVVDETHDIGKHPEFYSLFEIGTFNDSSAEIEPHEPVVIARAHELKAQTLNKED